MPVKLNSKGKSHAEDLIKQGKVDKGSGWDFTPADEDKILGDPPDWNAYSQMFLGVDPDADQQTKVAYKYPFGKDGKVYRAALVAIRQRAGQQDAQDIFDAAGRLLAAIDGESARGNARFEIRAAGEDTTEILIYGDIGESWDGASVSALDFVKQLAQISTSNILVRINSFGGSVADAIAIVNAMKQHPADITCQVDGVAISAASHICMGGDVITMAPNSLMMVHAPWGIIGGNARDLRAYADILDTFGAAMAQDYAAQTKMPAAKIMSDYLEGSDHWLTAQDAVQLGFADALTESADGDETEEAIADQLRAFESSRFMARAPERIAASLRTLTHPKSSQEDAIMPPIDNPQAAASDPKVVDLSNERIKARNKDIETQFKPFMEREGVSALYAEVIADPSITEKVVSERLLALLGKETTPANPAGGGRVDVGITDKDKRIGAMVQATLARAGADKVDGANPFRGLKMMDLARVCLEAAGVKTAGMDPIKIAEAALSLRPNAAGGQSTSDFPVLLENTMHKLVLTGFLGVKPKWQTFCKTGTVTDFRAWNRLVPGLIGDLDDVLESGEYKNKNIPDATKNSIQAKRRGNIIRVTPETLINDDLGLIRDMALNLGQIGPRAIDRKVFALLASNPVLSDGVALFHANHNNLAAGGAAPSVTTLDAARQAMGKQTAPGTDAEYLDIVPSVGVSSLANEATMRVIVGSQFDPDANSKLQRENAVRGLVGVIVGSARVADPIWYLFGDPNIAPVIEVVFLDGQQEPRVTMKENFDTSGLDAKVELPFGVGAIDYRGAYKNPGQ